MITSSLKTMRIHNRPPTEFLQAYREAFEIGEVTFGFVRQFPRGRVAFAGLYCEIDSDDKENEDDIKIVKADHDEDRMALVLMAHGEELQENEDVMFARFDPGADESGILPSFPDPLNDPPEDGEE
jgi:hypothetical protein